MKDESKTKKQLINESVELRQRIAELEASETERKQMEMRIERLNAMLRAIRNVNQLIAGEKDRDRLLKGACGTLIETRGYYNAWVAILDESGELVTTASLYSIELEEKHKRAEEKLQELYEQERKLRQELEAGMRRRVEFTRVLVHELKTPLTPIVASSKLLVNELREEPWSSLARNIAQGASNLNNRIDELLDLARGEIGILHLELEPVVPLQLLHEVSNDMAPVASSHRQSLILDLPPSLPLVWADKNRLRQVVLNLLNNAFKFTPAEGKITLKAREKGANLIVEVEDTGRGISEEEQQRLFEPYYRVEDDRQRLSGLGLGLALCKTLVELHGGQIWVKSQKGKGSTFSFSVPLETASRWEEGIENC